MFVETYQLLDLMLLHIHNLRFLNHVLELMDYNLCRVFFPLDIVDKVNVMFRLLMFLLISEYSADFDD